MHGAKNFRIRVIFVLFDVSEKITPDLLKRLLPEIILYSKANSDDHNARAINKSLQLLQYLVCFFLIIFIIFLIFVFIIFLTI